MTKTRQPRNGFEAMLSETLRGEMDQGGSGCPNPGILAAYHEGRLAGNEASRFEHHASTCDRCQHQLAMLLRSELSEMAIVRGRTSTLGWLRDASWGWRWMTTTAAAATAVLVLSFAIRLYPTGSRLETELAKRATVQEEVEQERAESRADVLADKSEPVVTLPRAAPAAPAEAPPPPEPAAPASAAPAAPVVPAPAAVEQAAPAVAGATEAKEKDRVAPERVAHDEAMPLASETRAHPSLANPRDVVERNAETLGATVTARDILIAAPGGKTLWRVGPQGRVERSEDSGTTWTLQASGVETDLVAGAALSQTLCWIVGRDGVILRTTDGTRWEKLTSPSAEVLTHVEALDADRATVNSATGRRFSTSDGGRTWRAD